MSNKTKMTTFKRNLYSFSGFTKGQKEDDSNIGWIDELIESLLDDDFMMKKTNKIGFDGGTTRSIILLYRLVASSINCYLIEISFKKDNELNSKLLELNDILINSNIDISDYKE